MWGLTDFLRQKPTAAKMSGKTPLHSLESCIKEVFGVHNIRKKGAFIMSKKKNKVPKITEEEYYAYIAGLKNDAALFASDGKMLVPPPFAAQDMANPERKKSD